MARPHGASQQASGEGEDKLSDLAIKTEGLTKHYGEVKALEDLDLEVKMGEVFGFLGPNGAGKTTTIRTILDLIRPTRGLSLIHI